MINVSVIFILSVQLRILKSFGVGMCECFDISDGGLPFMCSVMCVCRCLRVSPM